MNKTQIKDLIRKARLSKAVEALLDLTSEQDHLYSEAILISARLNKLERDTSLGIISTENANIARNQITNSLLYFLNQIDD